MDAGLRRMGLGLVLASTLGGCLTGGGDGGRKNGQGLVVHLRRVAAPGAAAKRAAGSPSHWTSDLDIQSLRVPIYSIGLSDTSFRNYQEVYGCSAGAEGCRVELAGDAWRDLLTGAPVKVAPGTYTQITVRTCADQGGAGYDALVTATVDLGGALRYIRADGGLSDSGPAQPADLRFPGCQRTYAIPEPLVVAATDSVVLDIPLQLYFDLAHIAWAMLPGGTPGPGGYPMECMGEPKSAAFVCAGYPDLAATLDTVQPTLERYRVNGGAIFGLYFNSRGEPFGGYTRRYYADGQNLNPGFNPDTPIWAMHANADSSLFLQSAGNDPSQYYFRAEAFRRGDHSGTYTSTGSPDPKPYTARRLP